MRRYKRFSGPAALLTILLGAPEPCFAVNDGSAALVVFIQTHIINQALTAFFGVAFAALFYYAVRMIVEAYNEKAFTNISNSFIYVFIGFVVIAITRAFADAFFGTAGGPFGSRVINPSILNPSITSVIRYMIDGGAGAFVLMVVIAGLRMVTAQGDEGAFDKWRKVLVGNCLGVALMMLASAIVTGIQSTGSPAAIINELRGIGIFLLTIVAYASVLSLILAGVFLIISVDEAQRDRAKKAIIGTLIALLMVIASYSIIVMFI